MPGVILNVSGIHQDNHTLADKRKLNDSQPYVSFCNGPILASWQLHFLLQQLFFIQSFILYLQRLVFRCSTKVLRRPSDREVEQFLSFASSFFFLLVLGFKLSGHYGLPSIDHCLLNLGKLLDSFWNDPVCTAIWKQHPEKKKKKNTFVDGWDYLASFPFIRDSSPVLLIVQCLKIVVLYILSSSLFSVVVFSSFLNERINSAAILHGQLLLPGFKS